MKQNPAPAYEHNFKLQKAIVKSSYFEKGWHGRRAGCGNSFETIERNGMRCGGGRIG